MIIVNSQYIVNVPILNNSGYPFTKKIIWILKLPLKIKIFHWYLKVDVILTKDNLTKRKSTKS